MEHVMDWLVNPIAKTILLFIGGIILKKWAPFVNKAIPVMLLIASAIPELLRGLFPALVPPAAADSLTVVPMVAHHGFNWLQFLGGTFLPVLVAVGTQSGVKNTREWSQYGWNLLHPPKA